MIGIARGFKGASILAGKRSSERRTPARISTCPAGTFSVRGLWPPIRAVAIPAAFVRTPTWHPFLYRKRIDRVEKGRPGDLVAVYGPNDRVLGYGLYNPRSEIAVRMTFYGEELPDDAAWQKKLDEAVELRHRLLRLRDVTDAYRVIYAEADGLPGLVVDRLGDVLSAEAYTLGMYQRAEAILTRLAPMLGTSATVVRPSPQFLSQEGCEPPGFATPDLPQDVTIRDTARGSASVLLAATRPGFSATSGRTGGGWPTSAKAARCSICAVTRADSPCRPNASARQPR